MDALKLMLEKQINHVPLCDGSGAGGKLHGMLSRRALLAYLAQQAGT